MLGDFVTLIERFSMKKFLLPSLFLTFMTLCNHSYSSDTILDENISSSRTSPLLPLPVAANACLEDANLIEEELKNLQEGINSLHLGNISEAIKAFKEAVGEGSPLGYLYLGALTGSKNDIDTAKRAVKFGALSGFILNQHIDYLVHERYLTRE